jgi:two-component system phosphate regulon response regulator PhoB
MKILIVEDERDIAELLSYNLSKSGFQIITAEDGEQALRLLEKELPDLVILDLLLPKIDGKEVCRRIRQNERTRNVPVLMLTALGEEVDRVVGFELGADDYVVKPFSPRELVLRINAILRRVKSPTLSGEKLEFEDLTIYPESYRVEVGGEEVQLTSTEFRLLYFLASNPGRIQTREVLLDRVWGYTYEGYARTVDTHVYRLREKLGRAGSRIETVRGIGYRFRG